MCEIRMTIWKICEVSLIHNAVNRVTLILGSQSRSVDFKMSGKYVSGTQRTMEDKNEAFEIEEVGRLDQYGSGIVRSLMLR